MTKGNRSPVETERMHTMICVLGASGHGKTSLLYEYVEQAQASGRPFMIIDPKNQWPHLEEAWWPDGGVDEIEDEAKRRIKDQGFSGMVVLDDCDMYLSARPKSFWREVFSSYRHLGLDVILNARRPQDLPAVAFASIEHLMLFNAMEVNARKRIAELFGDDRVLEQIPKERFRYCYLNRMTSEITQHRTRAMPVIQEADKKHGFSEG